MTPSVLFPQRSTVNPTWGFLAMPDLAKAAICPCHKAGLCFAWQDLNCNWLLEATANVRFTIFANFFDVVGTEGCAGSFPRYRVEADALGSFGLPGMVVNPLVGS